MSDAELIAMLITRCAKAEGKSELAIRTSIYPPEATP